MSLGYQCWICDQAIEESDTLAFQVTLNSLWFATEVNQQVYLHTVCACSRLAGKKYSIELDVFADAIAEGSKSVLQ